jgi:mRNA interferase MazF
MAIAAHPKIGTILRCDFTEGFKEPEMVKRRPVIVISPAITARPFLCTVVPLSTEPPEKEMPYHIELKKLTLPRPYEAGPNWVKGDMVCSVGFHRLDLIRTGKDKSGSRTYYYEQLSAEDLKGVRTCVLRALGLSVLTKHLV